MKPRTKVILLVVVVAVANVVFLAARWRTASSDPLEEVRQRNARTWDEIPQRLSVEQFDVRDVNATGRNFKLRLRFRPEDIGKRSFSSIVTMSRTELPTGGIQEFRMDAKSSSILISCASDASSGTFQSVTTANWAAFGKNSVIVSVEETTESELNVLGKTTIRSMKTMINGYGISSRLIGTARLRFPDEAVAVGDSWTLSSTVADDWPPAVAKRPPSLNATLEKIVLFAGIECALVTYRSEYYIESDVSSLAAAISDRPSEVQFTSSDAKAYVEVETGNILWLESRTECAKTGTTSVTRVSAAFP